VRLVLDANVLIAAFVSRGICHELLEHCEREHEMVSSATLLDEFEGKLVGKFKIPGEEARQARVLIEVAVELVEFAVLGERASRDPDDDRVLATAVAGACQCIITGDKDLLVLDPFQGIRIIRPSEFWSYEASADSPP
jgi:putative PIN family toxin of toxin-antitoxin system